MTTIEITDEEKSIIINALEVFNQKAELSLGQSQKLLGLVRKINPPPQQTAKPDKKE